MMSSNFQWYIKKQWGLSEEDTLKLQNFYEKRSLEKGEVLLQIEEFSNEYYFVESGLLKSYSYSSNGKEHILQFAPENWLIGDRGSIHLKERSSFYVEAIEDSLVCIFNESFFELKLLPNLISISNFSEITLTADETAALNLSFKSSFSFIFIIYIFILTEDSGRSSPKHL